jgi:transcriptional regulator with XRE-family HTH domain
VDCRRVATTFRAVRIRRALTQEDVARRARVHRSTVSRLERGFCSTLTLDTIDRVCAVLEIRLDLLPRWRGGDLDRLLNAGHAGLHEEVAHFLTSVGGWVVVPELTYSVFGERGAIDLFCWHAATRSVLVIELKTELVDINDLLSSMDRRIRLAWRIARDRGWQPRSVSAWVIVAGGTTNRRRLVTHETVLRSAFPESGLTMRSWCRRPSDPVRGLSLWSSASPQHVRRARSTPKRVRHSRGTVRERELEAENSRTPSPGPSTRPNVLRRSG